MADKVVLAYSGGLDTSAAIQWLAEERNMDVIALTIDIGGVRDLEAIRQKALKVGAIKALTLDARKQFVDGFIFPALRANVLYEGQYPLATALGRPLIAKLMVETAKKEGATAVAHGSTGKGNDQVRFDVSTVALAPELKVVAPAREWGMTREQTIAYAEKHGIPIPITVKSPYSIDENLWGRSIECGVLEDPWIEPPEEVFAWTKSPAATPDKPAYVEIGFEKGTPVSLDGKKLDGVGLIQRLNDLAGQHGVGRVDHVESRLVGIKSREIYEAPAATVLLKAHRALEAMTLSRQQLRFNEKVTSELSDIIYDGLWFSALRQDLTAYLENAQKHVSGTIRAKLHKGTCTVVGRRSPVSLYDHKLATYDKGDLFDHAASPGFIHIWGLPVKLQARIQGSKEDKKGTKRK
ncbi:MAG: argininosuccinate synthase [Chloroflexi bacterium]|nr:argininosuccinate synthase [Chloroflexota bacterium]